MTGKFQVKILSWHMILCDYISLQRMRNTVSLQKNNCIFIISGERLSGRTLYVSDCKNDV